MGRYVLSENGDADIEGVWQYIATKSGPTAADRIEEELHAAMHRLAEAPGIGHMRPEANDPGLRFFAVHSLLILYRPGASPLQIVRVLHGARDLSVLLRPREDEGSGPA